MTTQRPTREQVVADLASMGQKLFATTREDFVSALPGRIEIHRIICGQFGGPSTHDHQACENAANEVHDAILRAVLS